MREPKFQEGQVLRVANPDFFIASFGSRIQDRDAVLIENFRYVVNGKKEPFDGRVLVEFQKRNGRGKVFREVMRESDFVPKEAA